MLAETFLLILRLSANVGSEPFNLRVEVRTHADVKGEVCIQVEEQGIEFYGEKLSFSRSCWIAEQQAPIMTRWYLYVPFGSYLVKGWVNGKLGAAPINLRITCTEL